MKRSILCSMVGAASLCMGALPAQGLDARRPLDWYRRTVWSSDEGLPNSSIRAMVQTRDGYLWLATQEGVARFDGVRFIVDDLLQDVTARGLIEDAAGTLWILTRAGLVRYRDGQLERIAPPAGIQPEAFDVYAGAVAAGGGIWIATAAGAHRFHDGRWVESVTAEGGLPHRHVLELHEARDGSLWLGTPAGLVHRREGTLRVFRRRDGLAADTVTALAEDPDGVLWVGTPRGLSRYDGTAFSTFTTREGLSSDAIGVLALDHEGSLWIGTDGGGVDRLRQGRLTTLTSRQGLPSDSVWSLLEDRERSVWVGTHAGLCRLSERHFTMLGAPELSNDNVRSLVEDRSGALWVGTHGGLNRVDGSSVSVYTVADGLESDVVMSIHEDRGGRLWVGTAGGLARLDGRRFTTWTMKDGLGANGVRAIHEDARGTLWLGTDGGGLNTMRDGRIGSLEDPGPLADATVMSITSDAQSRVWVGTRGGLARIEGDRVARFYTRTDSLAHDNVRGLHLDGAGALWIGTRGGLTRFEDGRFSTWTRGFGLPHDVVFDSVADGRGFLWLSSVKGVFRVSLEQLESVAAGRVASLDGILYGKRDGMTSSECQGGTQPVTAVLRDGRLAFATVKGVALIDPSDVANDDVEDPAGSFPPVIERVVKDGAATLFPKGSSFPVGRGDLELQYTRVSLGDPDRVRFRYLLEGFDEDWVDAGPRRSAFYTKVPPGRYVFRVTTGDASGRWRPGEAAYTFDLRPHLHQTLGFRVAVVAGLCAVAAGAYAGRVRRLHARERYLSRIVEERTANLTEASQKLENANTGLREAVRLKDEVLSLVAHDFAAPLTLIDGYAQLLLAKVEDEEVRQRLGIIIDQSRHLSNLASDALTMSWIESGRLRLRLGPVDVSEMARRIVEMRVDHHDGVRVEAADADTVVAADADRIEEVIVNLVHNAVKYSPDGVDVRVRVERRDDGVEVSVADRGIGIAVADVPKLFQRFSRLDTGRRIPGSGLGLYICRSIVEAHGGRIGVEGELGNGATFRVFFPRGGPGEGSPVPPAVRE